MLEEAINAWYFLCSILVLVIEYDIISAHGGAFVLSDGGNAVPCGV